MAEIDTGAAQPDHASAGTTALEIALARQVRDSGRLMRQAQIRYFKTRSREDLIAAKQLEKQFDELIK